ncbi:MAG: hypothetical protein NUV57_02695 [archaeon]|nr:hypothetical protein [archaeon]
MDSWELKMTDFLRRGQKDRVAFLENFGKQILPTQLTRIQQNDKTIMKELVVPQWMDWELLYEWSNRYTVNEEGRECILCNNSEKNGMEFMEKWVCENCFLKLKHLE